MNRIFNFFFLQSFYLAYICGKCLCIYLEFSSPNACCIVDGFPRICLELLNLGHSSMTYLIVSCLSQGSQVGQYSFNMRR